LLHVADIMRTQERVPRVGPDAPLREGLLEMSRKGLGMTTVVDGDDHLLGIFTDGDLRRALDRQIDLHTTRMRDVMIAKPKAAEPRMLAAAAVHLMDAHNITALPVIDADNKVVGALNVHDLLHAGVM
jgi:arabinose-5-phosphate isomerase